MASRHHGMIFHGMMMISSWRDSRKAPPRQSLEWLGRSKISPSATPRSHHYHHHHHPIGGRSARAAYRAAPRSARGTAAAPRLTPARSERCKAEMCCSHSRCLHRMRKTRPTPPCASAFPMFVPSLSWQNDRFQIQKMARKRRSPRTVALVVAEHPVAIRGELRARVVTTRVLREKRHFCFTFPVLVPSLSWQMFRFSVHNTGQRRRFLTCSQVLNPSASARLVLLVAAAGAAAGQSRVCKCLRKRIIIGLFLGAWFPYMFVPSLAW